jgi:hypothetical protein
MHLILDYCIVTACVSTRDTAKARKLKGDPASTLDHADPHRPKCLSGESYDYSSKREWSDRVLLSLMQVRDYITHASGLSIGRYKQKLTISQKMASSGDRELSLLVKQQTAVD